MPVKNMSFHFPLQAVLHYRQSIEHQEEVRLRAANQQVSRVQHLIDQIDQRGQELISSWFAQLNSGISGAELQFGSLLEASLVQQRKQLEQRLTRMQQLRDQQSTIFQQAKRVRETLASVRDHQLQLYRKEALRREQRSLDDLFLMRRGILAP